jgi:hypothetical protein
MRGETDKVINEKGVSSDKSRNIEEDMKKEIIVLALCAMLFALCVTVQAQQPGKVYRIGLLISASEG